MKQKTISLFLILIFFLLLLAGCVRQTPVPKAGPAAAEKPSLDVWIFFDQNTPGTHYLDLWDTLAQELGYEVHVKTFATEELKDKLRISLACNELPDIFAVWGGTFPDFLIDADACLPVQDYIAASGLDFRESYLVPYRDGNNYIIPCLVEAYAVTYCNNALMEEIGVTAPSDWEELMELVRKTGQYNLANGTHYSAIELGDKDNWLGELLYDMVVNRIDPEAFDRLVAGEISFDDPVFLTAAEKCVELVDAGAFPEDFLITGEVESIENFINNESLLFPHQSTITFYLMDKMGTDALSLVQFPCCSEDFDPDYASNLMDINHTLTPGLCISKNSEHPKEAAKICLEFAQAVNEINVTEYGYLNFMDTELPVPENLPEPVTEFTSMVDHAQRLTSLWFALLPQKEANDWRSLTKRLFAKSITPEEFIAKGADYLKFPY